jgi:hypothetical protein
LNPNLVQLVLLHIRHFIIESFDGSTLLLPLTSRDFDSKNRLLIPEVRSFRGVVVRRAVQVHVKTVVLLVSIQDTSSTNFCSDLDRSNWHQCRHVL